MVNERASPLHKSSLRLSQTRRVASTYFRAFTPARTHVPASNCVNDCDQCAYRLVLTPWALHDPPLNFDPGRPSAFLLSWDGSPHTCTYKLRLRTEKDTPARLQRVLLIRCVDDGVFHIRCA